MARPYRFARIAAIALAGAGLTACATAPEPARAQQPVLPATFADRPTYVDLVEMVQGADIVARVAIDEQIVVPPERAPGLAPGKVRLYLESLTQALLGGNAPVGGSLTFLADLPALPDGKAPDLEEQALVIFANTVPGRPGEVQLAGPNAVHPVSAELERRIREVLLQLAEGRQPPRITGVREVISVEGNLAGESETQIFLETQNGAPVSLNVLRRPGQAPRWGVSWTEIVDQSAQPPRPETLQWYALACFLPAELPSDVFLQEERAAQSRARDDYRVIVEELGPCVRNS